MEKRGNKVKCSATRAPGIPAAHALPNLMANTCQRCAESFYDHTRKARKASCRLLVGFKLNPQDSDLVVKKT